MRKFHQALEKAGISVTKLVLYASLTTGKFHQDSDIDVAVVSSDFGNDRFEEGVRLFQIACKIDPRIAPVAISLDYYEKDTWIPLIYEIRENGVVIENFDAVESLNS